MAVSFTELAPSYSNLFQRSITMEWLPRWMESYYTDGMYRKLRYLGLVSPADELRTFTDYLTPKFYGLESVDRVCFTVNYQTKDYLIPEIVVNHGSTQIKVRQKDSIGSFLAEQKDPVSYYREGSIYLKNIANHTYAATSVSGQVLLSTVQASGIIEDSYILLENSYGDIIRFDQDSYSVSASSIFTGDFGIEYLVTYINEARYNALLADSTSYVTVGGERVTVNLYDYPSCWDEYSYLNGFKRNTRESNTTLKARCQFTSIARTSQAKIAGALGRAAFYFWDTTNSLDLSASGFYKTTLPEIKKFRYVSEYPTRVSNSLVLSFPATGATVFYNGLVVAPEYYSVNGSVLTLLSSSLLGANESNVRVNYKATLVTETLDSSGFVTALNSDFRTNLMVLATKDVKIINYTAKIKPPSWNRYVLGVGETAIFEG